MLLHPRAAPMRTGTGGPGKLHTKPDRTVSEENRRLRHELAEAHYRLDELRELLHDRTAQIKFLFKQLQTLLDRYPSLQNDLLSFVESQTVEHDGNSPTLSDGGSIEGGDSDVMDSWPGPVTYEHTTTMTTTTTTPSNTAPPPPPAPEPPTATKQHPHPQSLQHQPTKPVLPMAAVQATPTPRKKKDKLATPQLRAKRDRRGRVNHSINQRDNSLERFSQVHDDTTEESTDDASRVRRAMQQQHRRRSRGASPNEGLPLNSLQHTSTDSIQMQQQQQQQQAHPQPASNASRRHFRITDHSPPQPRPQPVAGGKKNAIAKKPPVYPEGQQQQQHQQSQKYCSRSPGPILPEGNVTTSMATMAMAKPPLAQGGGAGVGGGVPRGVSASNSMGANKWQSNAQAIGMAASMDGTRMEKIDVDQTIRYLAVALHNHLIVALRNPTPHNANPLTMRLASVFLEPDALKKLRDNARQMQKDRHPYTSLMSIGSDIDIPSEEESSDDSPMASHRDSEDSSRLSNKSLWNTFVNRRAPDLQCLYNFIKNIVVTTRMEPEINVICLLYIERLMQKGGVRFIPDNWRRLIITALLLASKVWDDESYENADFAAAFPVFNLEEINNMERVFLQLVDYQLSVKASDYASTYFVLRTLAAKDGCGEFLLQPLDDVKARQLSHRSKARLTELKKRYPEQFQLNSMP